MSIPLLISTQFARLEQRLRTGRRASKTCLCCIARKAGTTENSWLLLKSPHNSGLNLVLGWADAINRLVLYRLRLSHMYVCVYRETTSCAPCACGSWEMRNSSILYVVLRCPRTCSFDRRWRSKQRPTQTYLTFF